MTAATGESRRLGRMGGVDGGPRAVICDDDRVARQVIASMAETHGFHVVSEVELAIDAIRMVDVTKAALVILDVSMPGMSGLEAIDALRRRNPATRVVIVTSFDLSPDDPRV